LVAVLVVLVVAGVTAAVRLSGGGAGPAQPAAAAGPGCPPYPAFPDASCTGWRHTGVALRAVPRTATSGPGWHWQNGGVVVDRRRAVLDGLDIAGCVRVLANDVTVRRSRVACRDYYLIKTVDPPQHYTGLLVEDVELDGQGALNGSTGIAFDSYTARRVDAHALSSLAFKLGSHTVIEDSYVHGFTCGRQDGVASNDLLHQAGIGTNGDATDMVVRHNTIDLGPAGAACQSGGIANYHDFGTFDRMVIEQNSIDTAGGYCLKAGVRQDGQPYPDSTGVRVTGNVFGRKYAAGCGSYGPVSNWATGPGNVWSGNTWGGGAAAGPDPSTGDPVTP
jgi:hypothetical protein